MPASSSTSPPADATVLVVEDDPGLATVLHAALASRVARVEVVGTGAAALEATSRLEPDVVVLDLGLPDIDGIEVCRQLRRWYRNPVLVLTADGAEDRKVEALEQGADDYVTKPFSMPELLARVGVALRHRRVVAAVTDDRVLEVADVRIDTGAYEVAVAGEPVALTRLEFDFLVALARRPGRVVTFGALREEVWSGGDGSAETIRGRATSLRQKLGRGPGVPAIVSQPGVGYRLTLPE